MGKGLLTEKLLKSKIDKILGIAFVVVLILAVSLSLLFWFIIRQDNDAGFNADKITFFNSGWKIEGEERYIDLPTKLDIKANTEVAISKKLPTITNENECLLIRTTDQNVKIFVDGKEIYSYGYNDNVLFKSAESAWHLVELTEEDSEKDIKILTVTAYNHFSGTFNSVIMSSKASNIFYILNQNVFDLFWSTLFIVVAVALIVVGIMQYKNKTSFNDLICLGALALSVGFWSLSETKMLQFFTQNTYFYTIICHCGLTIGLISYCMFLLKTKNDNFCRVRFWEYLTLATILNFFIQTILQVSGLVDYEEMLFITQILLVITALTSVCAQFWLFIKKRTKETFFVLLSILTFGLMVALDVLFFYRGIFAYNLHLTRLGLLVFIVMLAVLSVRHYISNYTKAVKVKEELSIANTTILLSQIKPHFLYNALNSIKGLCILEPDKAPDAIQDFSTYLRANMGSIEAKEPIPFEKELLQIESYLNIEKLRFGSKLNIIYDIVCKDFFVPALSVEPFVENAIVHGILKSSIGGTVIIKTYETDANYFVEIIDDGVGFDTSIIDSSERVGIRNTILRLKAIGNGTAEISSKPGETRVKLIFAKNIIKEKKYGIKGNFGR